MLGLNIKLQIHYWISCNLHLIFLITNNAFQVASILAVSRNGDRLDHMIGNLNTLFLALEIVSVPVLILGYNSLTWLLSTVSNYLFII